MVIELVLLIGMEKMSMEGKLVQVCILQNWMFILMMEILPQNLSELY